MTGAGQQTVIVAGLVRWHLEEAGRAEREAGNTSLPSRRLRLLSTARYHRDCAELVREELP
ncbi:hypothetical protein F1643_07885 [Azospirillum sp. INR13]|uniref:hypothetical protein n=1 Tax=unclassified Azospirillum TaxID=2630922 RepID=UPI0011F0087B|nr:MULTISPECIES: hypothetical protein [unclassified Azospirillum]KAA0578885.1 hypothetical protein FZ983_16200 [Azospirillum sp. B21]MBF5094418.1 hypothetical protein [Azospirillum sp. INR13]